MSVLVTGMNLMAWKEENERYIERFFFSVPLFFNEYTRTLLHYQKKTLLVDVCNHNKVSHILGFSYKMLLYLQLLFYYFFLSS